VNQDRGYELDGMNKRSLSGSHPASYSMATGRYFAGDKAAGACSSPLMSIKCQS